MTRLLKNRVFSATTLALLAAVGLTLPLSCAKRDAATNTAEETPSAAAQTPATEGEKTASAAKEGIPEGVVEGEVHPVDAPGFTVKLMDGTKIDPTAQKGKVVVMDFWATWCGPCRMAIPMLQAFHEGSKGGDLMVVGLSDEDRATITPFARKMGMTYSLAVDPANVQKAAQEYGVTGLPTLLVLDKWGQVRFMEAGFNPDPGESGTEARLKKLIARLQAEKEQFKEAKAETPASPAS